MLRSIKHLYGDKLGASDGEIGRVMDCYFDDQTWAVRYLVADTGSWLSGRQVLVPPHSLQGVDHSGRVLHVNLTRRQIEHSPSIESHKPVSRQYEEEYYRYHGWPRYWQGDGLLGPIGLPILGEPASTPPIGQVAPGGAKSKCADAHLRSAQAVNGYHLRATNGTFGHVCDFMADDQSWVIDLLVIKTGHRFSGKEVRIPASKVARISYEESTVFVDLTVEAVEQGSTHTMAPVDERT